jgi:hypothetical protein
LSCFVIKWPNHRKNLAGVLGHEFLWIVAEENASDLSRATEEVYQPV